MNGAAVGFAVISGQITQINGRMNGAAVGFAVISRDISRINGGICRNMEYHSLLGLNTLSITM